jgi:hypothetical protein
MLGALEDSPVTMAEAGKLATACQAAGAGAG